MSPLIDWPARTAEWIGHNGEALLLGLAVAAGLVALMLVLRSLGERIARADPDCKSWRSVVGHVLAKTGILFMVAAALDTVARYAAPPPLIGRTIDVLFIVAFALQGAVWARELILGVIGRRTGDDAADGSLGNAKSVIRVLVSVVLFALAIVVILDNLGVNVTALVAGLGIGGIAIGLAAQGIFSDLFAALSILFDRPFRRGDTIRYDDSTGVVERIGLKTTRLRSLSGEQLIMANTKLLEREIHNLAEGASRRSALTFGLVYQTTPEMLASIPQLARAAVEAEQDCAFIRCVMTGFGASGIDHELLFDIRSLEPNALALARSAIMLALLRSFAEAGISFAYPTQTSFTAAPDGTLIMPYAAAPEGAR